MWFLLVPVVFEGIDYLHEMSVRKLLEMRMPFLFHDANGNVVPGTHDDGDQVLVMFQLEDGRYCLHVRDKSQTGASSNTVREYLYNPQDNTLSNTTLRQAFGWKSRASMAGSGWPGSGIACFLACFVQEKLTQ
jgi:hypothetical protein